EAGQLLALGPQAVAHPRAGAGTALDAGAGVEEETRARVLRKRDVARADEAHFVNHRRQVREEVADWQATLAVLLELPRAGEDLADVVELRRLDFHQLAGVAAVVLIQHRLGVERVDLRRPPVHVEEDYVLGLRREVGRARLEGRPDGPAGFKRRGLAD